MSREILLMGNWKMNHTICETVDFLKECKKQKLVKLAKDKNITLAIAPTYLSLQVAAKNSNGIHISAQDCHYMDHGAYTSNISVPMLKEIGVNWSLVGHSERRAYEGDSSETCNKKIKALVSNGFKVVYCVGETLDQFEQNQTKDVIKQQVTVGLDGLTKEEVSNIIIAYEPVWSIGTGKNASKEIAQDICSYIRGLLTESYQDLAQNTLILYGGSVKPENIHDYLTESDVDGALVGGASLKAESFKALIENI